MIWDFIMNYLGDVLQNVAPAYREYIVGTVAIFLITTFSGALIQLLFSAVGLIYNIRGVRKK